MALTARHLEAFVRAHPDAELWLELQRDGELIREKVLTMGWDIETRTVTFRGESTKRKIVYEVEDIN